MQKNSIQEFRKNFYYYYHKNVMPTLLQFEKERKQWILIYRFLSFFILSAAIISGIYLYTLLGRLSLGLIVLLMALIIIYFSRKTFKKKFESKVKPLIMESLMKAFGNFHWTEKPLIKSSELFNAKIFGKFTKRNDDDNFYGKYNDVDIVINEMALYEYKDISAKYRNIYKEGEELFNPEYYVKSEMRKKYVQTFYGIVLKVPMNKNFTGETFVGSEELINPEKHDLEQVQLEDVEFNKIFSSFSTNQVEARYILTASFMERLKEISKEFKTKSIFAYQTVSAAFLNNTAYIAISSAGRDMFSICDFSKPLTNAEQYQKLFNDIISVISIIDTLKLDTKTNL